MEIIIIIIGVIASIVTILTFIFGPESMIGRWKKWRSGSKNTNKTAEPTEQKLALASPANKEGFAYDVFISYSSVNKDWVRKDLLIALEKTGLKACIDFRDFKPGKPAIKNIRDGILESKRTLLVVTEPYLKSGWTDFENMLSQTIDPANREGRIIPLLKEKCDLPLEIKYLTYVNFFDPDDWDIVWRQLFGALGAKKESVSKKKAKKLKETLQKSINDEIPIGHNTINSDYAIRDFSEMLNPNSARRIMHIWSDSMMGKSHLTREVFPTIARNTHTRAHS